MKVLWKLLTCIVGLILLLTAIPPVFSQPKAIKIKQKLERTPPHKHASIYREILKDTSVLKHPALQKKLVRLADDVWYDRWLRGNMSERPGANPLVVKQRGPYPPARNSFINFSKVAKLLKGRDFVKVWLKIIPGRWLEIPQSIPPKLKSTPSILLREYLRNASVQKNKKQDEEYRFMMSQGGSGNTLNRIIYEAYLRGQKNRLISKGLEKRIIKHSKKLIRISDEFIAIPKTFAVAILLNQGESKNILERQLVFGSRRDGGGREISDNEVERAIFREAKKWRSEYPKWAIDQTGKPPKNGKGKKKKVTICHIPPGNPSARHTIRVGKPAVPSHLNHGDHRGPCQ